MQKESPIIQLLSLHLLIVNDINNFYICSIMFNAVLIRKKFIYIAYSAYN